MPSHIPPIMSLIPLHALSQSPVKIPVINVITPFNTVKNAETCSPIAWNTASNTGAIIVPIKSTSGFNTFCHKSFSEFIKLSISGLQVETMLFQISVILFRKSSFVFQR